MDQKTQSVAQHNIDVHIPQGLRGWRYLYVSILKHVKPSSLLEVGSGSPEFLKAFNECPRRVAIDGGSRWAQDFLDSGVEFYMVDLDVDDYPTLEPFQVTICSDVFEHLLFPDRTLKFLAENTLEDGFMITHVPNEFHLKKTFRIMLGLQEAKYSHPHCEEYNNPHLHRFTKVGFKKFLQLEFPYNLFISDLRYDRLAKLLKILRIGVPYALEGGPTFMSTRSEETFKRLQSIKQKMMAEKTLFAGDRYRN